MKNRKTKWLVTICGIIIFLFAGSMIPSESLNNRSMVVGFGIDLVNDNTIRISAQILTTTATGTNTAISSSRVVTQENQTITGAMVAISKVTGASITLTHCNIILLGADLIKSQNAYSCLNYIIINDYLNDNALVFGTEGKAEDILSSKTGFGNNASVYLQRIVGKYADYNTISLKSIHELLIDYHQKGQVVWVPIIKKLAVSAPIVSSGDAGGSGGDKEPDFVFDVQDIAITKKDTFLGIYDKACTSSLNYVLHKVERASLNTKGDKGEDISFYIINSDKKLDYDWATKTVKFTLKLQAILKEIVDYSSSNKSVDRWDITESELHRAENKIVMQMEAFHELMQALDCDVYAFEEGFYAEDKKEVKDFRLSEIKFIVDVKIIVN